MSSLQVTDKWHRHTYSPGELLLRQVQQTPAFTNQSAELVRPRGCHRVPSFIPGRYP